MCWMKLFIHSLTFTKTLQNYPTALGLFQCHWINHEDYDKHNTLIYDEQC